MSRTLAVMQKLREFGLPADQILDVLEVMESSEPSRSSAAERQARYRARKAGAEGCDVTDDVTGDVTGGAQSPPIKSSPITPIKLTPPTSLRSDTSAREIFANEFWPAYPRKTERKAAEAKFIAVVKSGVDPLLLVEGARRYAASKPEAKFTKHATTWLSKGCWEDELLPRAGPKRSGGQTLADIASGDFFGGSDERFDSHDAGQGAGGPVQGASGFGGRLSERDRSDGGPFLDLRPAGSD